jgi:hypothetical protein
MSKKDGLQQSSISEFKENLGSQHRSQSRSKNKLKQNSSASSGERKGDRGIGSVNEEDRNVSDDDTQVLSRKRNKNQLEFHSAKLKDGPTKGKKKDDDNQEDDDDNEEDDDEQEDDSDNGEKEYSGGNHGAKASGSGSGSDRGQLKSWAGNSSGFEAQIGPFFG